jgi:FKBP-type peptidyl-prolyl cis-trans isomerase (trigger factor)
VGDEDLNERFESLARSYNEDVKKVRQYYESNELIGGLIEQIREEKALDWILGQADLSDEKK